jgi:hypothetical protein
MNSAQTARLRSRDADADSLFEGLALSEGFMVDASGSHIGVVNALRYEPSARGDRPNALAVHAGRSSETLLIVPVAEVESVFPAERRVVLRPSPRIVATEQVTVAEPARNDRPPPRRDQRR